ncbi:hypothetical protein [Mitsuaria sp. 7]|uniref:hypothetical protein n=1 Tax=Mitsuaria sp. 7 TaxID=1658665 RepID=UPI0008304393|nr:hypothetical protein [Mitsuaria sp. 7]
MADDVYSDSIRKSGFVLEHQVAQDLKIAGWTVISNKYYVDDQSDAVREVDLVAYRTRKVQHFDVCTVLIVSCKKSADNAWAFLARPINLNDKNSDWWPVHIWSNDPALQYVLGQPGVGKQFHGDALQHGVTEVLETPTVEVFAFQEMKKGSGAVQNDKAIFSSITGLMKAQAYEMQSLPGRKKDPCVYQFNLVSVVDTDLVRIHFDGDGITSAQVHGEHYIGRYIINKAETFARIRLVAATAFQDLLEDFARLHRSNCDWFASECTSFYQDIVKDPKRVDALADLFNRKTLPMVNFFVRRKFGSEKKVGPAFLYFDEADDMVRIGYEADDDVTDFMDSNDGVRGTVQAGLKAIYRYEGDFSLLFDIPF